MDLSYGILYHDKVSPSYHLLFRLSLIYNYFYIYRESLILLLKYLKNRIEVANESGTTANILNSLHAFFVRFLEFIDIVGVIAFCVGNLMAIKGKRERKRETYLFIGTNIFFAFLYQYIQRTCFYSQFQPQTHAYYIYFYSNVSCLIPSFHLLAQKCYEDTPISSFSSLGLILLTNGWLLYPFLLKVYFLCTHEVDQLEHHFRNRGHTGSCTYKILFFSPSHTHKYFLSLFIPSLIFFFIEYISPYGYFSLLEDEIIELKSTWSNWLTRFESLPSCYTSTHYNETVEDGEHACPICLLPFIQATHVSEQNCQGDLVQPFPCRNRHIFHKVLI